MLSISRMEMEHLAIANNLLTALGEAPFFQRDAFPIAAAASPTELPYDLQRFTLESLGWYVLYELPDPIDRFERDFMQWLKASPLKQDQWLLAELDKASKLQRRGIVALYDEIETLLKKLGAPGSPPLFIGPPAAQVSNASVMPSFPPRSNAVRAYDVLIATITDLPSALAAIEQVRSEGEGGKSVAQPTGGHFVEFVTMYKALSERTRAKPAFDPSRPVVTNPRAPSVVGTAESVVTPVTQPAAAEAMALYDLGYWTCLRMLTRFFASVDPAELPVLQDAVFFPMMTLFLRPLGDLLTQMPATAVVGPVAGPSFVPPSDPGLQPHAAAANTILLGELQDLRDRAAALAARTDLPAPVKPRLAFLAENMWRLAWNFQTSANFGIPS